MAKVKVQDSVGWIEPSVSISKWGIQSLHSPKWEEISEYRLVMVNYFKVLVQCIKY